ncbi:hypothetical protein D1006_25465 [Burkholderia stabilis]|uniref:Uncharacterized protein n=1 Tax=Burkholderia stabilis TaxID=95485 RepID=A0A4Q2AJC9_9BURK|nr:hypothetical protein D1006_25465 [Burkholderia stabilis]
MCSATSFTADRPPAPRDVYFRRSRPRRPAGGSRRPAGRGACPPSNFKDCYTFAQFRLPAGILCLSASNVRISRTHLTP